MSWESCHFHLPSGAPPEQIPVQGSRVGSVIRVADESGFHIEIHIISNSSNTLTSELQVIAVRQLNGVTVECDGPSGNFMSTIQVASIGESTMYTIMHYVNH